VFVEVLQCKGVIETVDATAFPLLVVAVFVVLPNADGSDVVIFVNADSDDVVVGADDGTVDVDICVGTAAAGVIFVVDVVELNSGSDAVGAVEVGLGLILDDFVLAVGSMFCWPIGDFLICISIEVGVLLVAVVDVLSLATATVDNVVIDVVLINGIDTICDATAVVNSFIDCVDAGAWNAFVDGVGVVVVPDEYSADVIADK